MGLKLKTKQERKDSPLGESPVAEAPVTDLKTALADINKRSSERQKAINDAAAKVNADRAERSRNKKPLVAEGRLYGLASFGNTTGR